ncbi:MAG: 4a-hydroxytetrahydrobiopterin dehydratase [Halodesulfurarchaeum sp.]
MTERLSEDEIETRLPRNWSIADDEIVRTFTFDDYLDGVTFAVDVGELAEEEFHHPTIEIGYEEVTVRFTSHEEGGITNRDIEMAELVNELR